MRWFYVLVAVLASLAPGCASECRCASLHDAAPFDAGPPVDAFAMCTADQLGVCASPDTRCLECPTGPITRVLFCTRDCTSNADCTDPAMPTCSQGAGFPSGICVPVSQTCSWGLR